MTATPAGLIYDAVHLLGFGHPPLTKLPNPDPGEVVIRVGTWSLKDLLTCDTIVRDGLMCDATWCGLYDWRDVKITPGVYRVRMRIPKSNGERFDDQNQLLLPRGEEVAPVALAAAVLVCHLKVSGKDLLDGHWTRCAEELPGGDCRVEISVDEARVSVSHDWDGRRSDRLWLAGCRKCAILS